MVHCCTIGSALCARQQTNVARRLSAESVEGLALALERVDDVHGRDGLAASVLSVRDRVADDVLKEDLEDTAGLLVDEARDALDSTPASEAANRGLRDALDVVAQHLAVALGTALAESLSSLSASCGGDCGGGGEEKSFVREEIGDAALRCRCGRR